MAQKPLSQMADRGYDKMGEESGYILHELKAFAAQVSAKLENEVPSKKDFLILCEAINKITTDSRLGDLASDYQRMIDGFQKIPELIQSVNNLSELVTALTVRVTALETP